MRPNVKIPGLRFSSAWITFGLPIIRARLLSQCDKLPRTLGINYPLLAIPTDHPNVMVSSTYSDLVHHREAAYNALHRLGFFPISMDFDSAKFGKDVIESSMEMVSKPEAYVGILSHRYGGVPEDASRNPNQLSITELEYRRAHERGIPVYMFLMSADHAVRAQDVEKSEMLDALKAD